MATEPNEYRIIAYPKDGEQVAVITGPWLSTVGYDALVEFVSKWNKESYSKYRYEMEKKEDDRHEN